MPRAVLCLGCGRPSTKVTKGRCPRCRLEKDRADPYQSPEWRRISKEARDRIVECAICGSRKRLIVHHRHARKEGGADVQENFMGLCGEGAINMPWRSCHSQYEADKRTGKDTWLRRTVEAL